MIFISYATENLPYATEIYRQLQLKGYNVWFAPVAIRYGANFTEEIGNAILQTSAEQLVEQLESISEEKLIDARIENHSSCKALIFICSRFSKNSVWCRKEIKSAITNDVPVFVIRVDNSDDSNEWKLMLFDIQSIVAYKPTAEVIGEVLNFLPEDIVPLVDAAPKDAMDTISFRDIELELISSGDPYFEESESLFCKLSKQCFYLSPPLDMVTDDIKKWREEHFSSADIVFDSTIEYFQEQTGITDLVERIEKSRRKVFLNFVNQENGCYFNNKKYGISKINPYGRTEDYSEIPVINIELYTTDYYTHRVIKDVCKNLYAEHHELFHKNFNYGLLEKYKILLTSLGINLLLVDADKRLHQKTLLTVRSVNCTETNNEERYSLSVIEGVSLSDYDHFQRKVSLSDAVKRGLDEELGVKPVMIDNDSIRFYDLFINLRNMEIGISCSAVLKENISLDYVSKLNGKDKLLEVCNSRILKTSELRDFVLTHREQFLSQAICAIGSYVNRYCTHPLLCNEVRKYNEEHYVMGKQGNLDTCEDIIVRGKYFYAIIDGVTSKSKLTYDGKSGGRYASEILARAIEDLDEHETALTSFKRLDKALANLSSQSPVEPENRLQASVIIYSKSRREVWNYGDCNLMINERRFLHTKKIDDILSALRAFVISVYLKEGGTQKELRNEDVGRTAIMPFLKKQALFANSEGYFGYPVIDGTGINENFIKIYRVFEGDHVVLASDGYPQLFSSLEESEKYLRNIIQADPLSIDENMQTKMITGDNVSFDDRAYLSFFVD